jgi:hypothetical protein
MQLGLFGIFGFRGGGGGGGGGVILFLGFFLLN